MYIISYYCDVTVQFITNCVYCTMVVSVGDRSFALYAANCWNNLPLEVRESGSDVSFHKKLSWGLNSLRPPLGYTGLFLIEL